MNTVSRLLVAAALLAPLSLRICPAMAVEPSKKAAVQPEDIALLMPPIVIIGKRMTPEEKIAFTQQQRAPAMKKVARKKTEQPGSPALSVL